VAMQTQLMVKLTGFEVTFNYQGLTLWACTFVQRVFANPDCLRKPD